MKKLLFAVVILVMGTQLKAQDLSSSSMEIKGVLTDLIVGEIDPLYIGDACLIELTTATGESVGLVTSDESCSLHRDQLFHGRPLVLQANSDAAINHAESIGTLKRFLSANQFYRVEFSVIGEAFERALTQAHIDIE